jgi:hypothetical protein
MGYHGLVGCYSAWARPSRAPPDSPRPHAAPFFITPCVFLVALTYTASTQIPNKSAALRTDDSPDHPIGLGGPDLVCICFEKEKGRIAKKLCLVQPERAIIYCVIAATGLWHLGACIFIFGTQLANVHQPDGLHSPEGEERQDTQEAQAGEGGGGRGVFVGCSPLFPGGGGGVMSLRAGAHISCFWLSITCQWPVGVYGRFDWLSQPQSRWRGPKDREFSQSESSENGPQACS